MDEPQRVRLRTNPSRPRHRTVARPVVIILAQKRHGSQTNRITDGVTRHFSRAAGHSWQSGSAFVVARRSVRPAPATSSVLTNSADSSSSCIPYGITMEGRQAGRQAGSSNNRLFLPRSPFPVRPPLAAHSSARHAKNDAMRCDAPLCNGRNLHARPNSQPSPSLPLSLSPSLLASVPFRPDARPL